MIEGPKQTGDWPDRALDCEEAIEPAFIAIADRLQAAGLSPDETARQLVEATADRSHWAAPMLRDIAEQAQAAGWHRLEVANGIVSLAHNYRLAVEANAETDRQIRRAWGEPD